MFDSPINGHSRLSNSPMGSWGETLSNATSSTPTVQKSKFFQDITSSNIPSSSFASNQSRGHQKTNSRKFQRKDPAQIARYTVNESLDSSHILPYSWTFFFHSRRNGPPAKQLEGANNEATAVSTDPAAPAATTASSAQGNASASEITDATNVEKKPEIIPTSVDTYLQTTKEIEFPEVYTKDQFNGLSKKTMNIATVEQLWEALSLLKRTNDLPIGSEVFVFKSGVEPVWEDKINAKGGRWMFKLSRRAPQYHNSNIEDQNKSVEQDIAQIRKRNALIWERLVLRVLGGSLIPADNINGELILNDISGLVISIRRDEDIISIWNTNLCFDKRFQESYFKSILASNPSLKNPLQDASNNAAASATSNIKLADEGVISNANGDQEITNATNSRNQKSKGILFNDRRMVCSSVLNVIREVDQVIRGANVSTTKDMSSTERVYGVIIEYRLHSDNSRDNNSNNSNDSNSGHDSSKHDNNTGGYHNQHHSNHRHRNNNNNSNSSGTRRYNKYNNNNSNNSNNKNGYSNSNNGSTNSNNSSSSASTNDGNGTGDVDASKIFESGSFANLGRRRRRNNNENGDEPKTLMSLGSRRRLQNLQKNSANNLNNNNNNTSSNGTSGASAPGAAPSEFKNSASALQ